MSEIIGRVSGQPREGDQVPGMPNAICHACGLGYRCPDIDCPNDKDRPATDYLKRMFREYGSNPPADTSAAPAKAEAYDKAAADKWAVHWSKWERPMPFEKADNDDEETFNLARAYQAEREAGAALRREVEQLRARLVCMCGQELDKHSAYEGHSGVSMYDYALDHAEQRAEAAERREGELREALDVHEQAIREVEHAQDAGPGWYTKGENGLYQQVRLWIRKAQAVSKALGPTP